MMNLMNVKMDVAFDPEDLIIDCVEAGKYCATDLSCKKCPFDCGEKNLAELISDYTQMLVSSDRKLREKRFAWQGVVEELTNDLQSYIEDHKAAIEDCDRDPEGANDHYTYISAYRAVLKDLEFLVHENLPKEILK